MICCVLWTAVSLDARGNEFAATRVSVDAQFADARGQVMDTPPLVGERSFLRVVVTAREAGEGRVPVSIEFESEVEAEALPGFRRKTVRRPYTVDETNVVYETEHVFAGSAPAEWFVPITVRGAGHSTIRVRAESLREDRNATAELAVTFGERSSSRGFNLPPRETVEYHTLNGGYWPGCFTNGLHGYARFKEPDGDKKPVQGAVAKLYVTPNDGSPVKELGSMVTQGDGHFYFCDFEPQDGILTVKIFAEHEPKEDRGYRVRTGGKTHFMTSCDNCPGPGAQETKFLGDVFPDSDSGNRGFHIFDVARQAFGKIASDNCWGFAGQCRQMQFVWEPGAHGANFQFDPSKPEDDYVWLGGTMADDPDAIVHEIGHALKYRLYDDTGYGDETCMSNHSWSKAISLECAFEEGFAGWLPTWVFDKDDYEQEGKTWSLEKPSFKFVDGDGVKWRHGPAVEGRVAGALHDIVDSVSSLDNPGLTTWDDAEVDKVRNRVFKAMRDFEPKTMEDFVTALYDLMSELPEYDTDGKKAVLHQNLRSSCFQNTIDFQFRNTLPYLYPRTFPPPFSGHADFGPEVSHGYWFWAKPGWNLVSIQTASAKSLGLFKDKLLIDPLGDAAGTCHDGLPQNFPPPCGELAFVAYQKPDALTEKRYAEVRGLPAAESAAKPYTIEEALQFSTALGSKTFHDSRSFRVIALNGLVNGEATSLLVEPMDYQQLSIALLPATPEAVDFHHPDIVWSLSDEPDTRPIIRFTPNAPAGKTYALVVMSTTPGSISVHVDQKPPKSFTPALGFYEGNPYADPYPEFSLISQVDGPKTSVGYTRNVWNNPPNWPQAPWTSEFMLHTFVEEVTGTSGTTTTARLRPTHWSGQGKPEFQVTMEETPPGSTLPLCLEIMSNAGFVSQSCTNAIQFPSVHPKYYYSEHSKNF